MPISEVLASLGVGADDWHIAVVGDGSGQGWGSACGWCAVLHDHYANRRHEQHGANSAGTSNLAELLPYFFTLMWYSRGPGKARLLDIISKHPGGQLKVHLITDSMLIANQGNGNAKRKEAGALWAAFDYFTAQGYNLRWHWLDRARLGLNQVADHLSRQSRKAIERSVQALEEVELPEGTNIYSFNAERGSNGQEESTTAGPL